MAFGLTLLVSASSPPPAVAWHPVFDTIPYSIITPAPDGQSSCELFVSVTKRAGIPAALDVRLFAFEGEAQIAELFIGAGEQPGCDLFPVNRFIRVPLDASATVFFFVWTLDVHAQGSDCETGGQAVGVLSVTGLAVEDLSVAVLPCE
ncbi:MAG: hypothetical protein HY724_12540 [Candidatus Rokubacteria bacterium]|nr:hypothetical protein [Candidatus Rokubacteria bacterium]